MFIPLRYYCDGKLGCSSGGKMNTHATTVQYLEIMKIALYKKLLFRKLQLSSFIITLLKFLH
ncbi:hypothetical protein T4B_10057 [Trichinella pseudospiralis]|uniref:Uncharacterized protein n=1 Tax=Trichinella pseudospiralis TaxID=6337 RepID=A0A0V1ISV8_TRIPS|nr:hypothetical protein T4B_10057 [Trichinella pseudospiralis]KRZ37431.1 hypothetical protein T4C_13968 [Trichinella pseudospiralis]